MLLSASSWEFAGFSAKAKSRRMIRGSRYYVKGMRGEINKDEVDAKKPDLGGFEMRKSMSSEQRSWLRSRSGWVLLGFLAIAAFFLWEEHKAHLLGILPYGLLLLCPLMHLFHGGHGGGEDGHDHAAKGDHR